jgi:hypothetical protein
LTAFLSVGALFSEHSIFLGFLAIGAPILLYPSFIELSGQLNRVQHVEKIVRPSELSGQCISNPWYVLKHPEGAVL